jgi:hypothetical protein
MRADINCSYPLSAPICYPLSAHVDVVSKNSYPHIRIRIADAVNNCINVPYIYIYILNTTQRYQHPLMNVIHLDNFFFF